MSAIDRFDSVQASMAGPASRAFSIAPHATNELAFVTRAISVNGGGDVAIVTVDGDSVTVTLAAGVLHPIRAKKVLVSGTTATGIIGWH